MLNVVIVGGGEIGSLIADALQYAHNVTILDQDAEKAQNFETMDVRFVQGNGSDPQDLRATDVHKADAFIACTTNDDVNVLSCLAAKGIGAKKTMAFVTRERYVQAFKRAGPMESVGLIIDEMLWPQQTLAKQISEIVQVPRAVDSASFGDGQIKQLEYRLEPHDDIVGRSLADIRLPRSVLVVGSIRAESFIIPSGKTVLREGDKVVFMGTAQSMHALEARFAPKKRVIHVTIIGGGNVGFMVAEQLEHRTRVTIIEEDEARCDKLARHLPNALILHGDGTDLELLEQERVEDADVLVAVTDDDGKNLLVSLLGKQLGIPKVVTRVGRARNRRLFERVGIDTALTPRATAVQEVLNWLELDEVDHLASIEDRAEVMELTYPDRCETGKIRDLGAPPRSLIGAILRGDEVIIPHGDTTIRHGDRLYIVTTPDNVDAVHDWLKRRRVAAPSD